MARIPVMFNRVAAAFDADVARCESSGSEHLPESSTHLSHLVKSFMEKNEDGGEKNIHGDEDHKKKCDGDDDEGVEKYVCSYSEKRKMLEGLFAGSDVDEDERKVKEKTTKEVEVACGIVGDYSLHGFKRRLMTHLREKGFDAGLCKSKWEKSGRITSGDYEYIDVIFSGKRYIVEVSLASEFIIARATSQYTSLLDVFPLIFVGKMEDLNRVVRLMCTAIKGSMKRKDLHVPPWRRNDYMQAKWFSSYKRTTNVVATKKTSSTLFPKRSIGFEARQVKAHYCRDDYVSNSNGFRIGHLKAALNSDGFGV
ncbi:hypothetical protein TanjilG_31730 [Lupinus angustifolius]|uniref:DUF506 family protein n=1 Tax=Lupinus angustifolius TaxID=3871 RepID=A0A4P1RLT6_LUPAN|nr:PREDICTED: uncharacterized protein LOC109344813 [Lupinus angustifolius]OIW13841.1 hypothetical protein TanjilG_31730 [Lupinus angustifolius]